MANQAGRNGGFFIFFLVAMGTGFFGCTIAAILFILANNLTGAWITMVGTIVFLQMFNSAIVTRKLQVFTSDPDARFLPLQFTATLRQLGWLTAASAVVLGLSIPELIKLPPGSPDKLPLSISIALVSLTLALNFFAATSLVHVIERVENGGGLLRFSQNRWSFIFFVLYTGLFHLCFIAGIIGMLLTVLLPP